MSTSFNPADRVQPSEAVRESEEKQLSKGQSRASSGMSFRKSLKLEFFKIKNQGFWLVFLATILVPTVWILYTNRNIADTGRVVFETQVTCYYAVQDQMLSILSIVLPVMASVMISRLCDEEHKGDTWKLLRTSNQSIRSLWDAKFLIVYVCLELTVLIVFVCGLAQAWLQTGIPVPVSTLALNYIGISAANIITLTIAQILSVYFKNQIIVLVEGLAGGLIGVLSSLMPSSLVPFLPWGYYTLNFLAGMQMLEPGPAGNRWMYLNLTPNYTLILAVGLVFIGIGLFFRNKAADREL